VGIVLTIALAGVSAVWLGGTPPSRIVLATGQPGGVYDSFGREYQKRLRAQGLMVELVNTAGSVDNFRRIIDGKADVAFAQSGTYQVVSDPSEGVSRGHLLRAAWIQRWVPDRDKNAYRIAACRWGLRERHGGRSPRRSWRSWATTHLAG
jgi:hypothetical protein